MKNTFILPLACLPFTGIHAQSKTPPQPNIVFILADDLGWNDLSCTGSQYYESPNIDRIAQAGIRFTQGYAACQVSSPSRTSILTGKFPARHGITNWIGEASGEAWRETGRHSKLLPAEYLHHLPLSETTLPEALRENGYRTFMAGKWHLGGEGSMPEDHGFDVNVGGNEYGSPRGGYFSPYQNPQLTDGPEGENLSMRLARETVSLIETHTKRNRKQPFFACLSFYAVHSPIQTTRQNWHYFREKAAKKGIADEGFIIDRTLPVRQTQDNPVYAGLIRQMDDATSQKQTI
ncbi:MAG: sulfatase-like hydrolase/transferase [Tannerella sp.]|jgi:arylsulfatase A-like enzyme|nr:sulfatase-like hydrolase/transferase [Tannerella sp.]